MSDRAFIRFYRAFVVVCVLLMWATMFTAMAVHAAGQPWMAVFILFASTPGYAFNIYRALRGIREVEEAMNAGE